jgi:hypothetical protein
LISKTETRRNTEVPVWSGGQHDDHDAAARHPGEAATVCEGDCHGNDRDDQVRQRGGNVAGQVAQPEKELSNREYRQVKGEVRRVANDPSVQQEVTVQHVPRLQRTVRPVRTHVPGERDPQVEGEQRRAADDPRRRAQQAT